MKKQIDVVGAVIVRKGLVYCVQRGLDVALPGLWEFPGGKIEPGEGDEDALVREIHEELLCRVTVGEKVTTTSHAYDFGIVRLTTYYCELDNVDPEITEHSSELWARPEELPDLAWAPADVPAVQLVARRLLSRQ